MKYALVTGGTKGIGKAISQALLERNYFVILNYANDDDSANETYIELNKQYSDQLRIIKEDLSQPENIAIFCNKVKEITKSIEVLVLNAGKTDRSSFGETDYNTWLSVFETNLFAPYFIIQELNSIMPWDSSIIVTGSVMGIYPHSMSISYGVSKAAVHAMVKNLVKFLSPFGIRINAIAPGFIETEWQKNKPDEIKKNIERKISLSRFGTPEEIAEAVIFLIHNKYINGEILKVDGAYSFM
ncbi:MAG TPA: short-chain dehydrogenase [Prolixibacteraceae bacterium]|nr:short-chain dehydrogenase [Prolixibacteraceae bacterium]